MNEPFPYHEIPVRGINLGGWLVLEPFITPSLFEIAKNDGTALSYNAPIATDEWMLCKRLGPIRAKELLEHHYETFITEADFEQIQKMGFNHVRIPIGHWAIRPQPNEPFVPHLSWKYMLRGIEWAKKYGLRVMIELHTAAGSQNGWNHSGREGRIRWLVDPIDGEYFAQEAIEAVKDVVDYFYTNQTMPGQNELLIPMIGVLNEPAIMMLPHEPVFKWYRRSHDAIRNMTGKGSGPIITYHDGFLRIHSWNGFFRKYDRAVLESHLYLIFEPNMMTLPHSEQIAIPCNTWRQELTESKTLVGEFSFATNDCGKYLNGVRTPARYEGTGRSCHGVDDWLNWTDEYKEFMNVLIQKQMNAYEAGMGWFFWTYKTEDHVNPHWDYLLAWKKGWAPKDVNTLAYTCDQTV
ncbi:glycoside hydrolase [Hesseltinella vesiculosa]|uniref:glucan 1,3-beta-glucosidase n=1 Tax=Hesseltinella vesiculosa TaxID=101127 RepID=A0A1X2GX28_9FUNG|nr:glycoside hydrolase [Hesseltinella vesiculosa]